MSPRRDPSGSVELHQFPDAAALAGAVAERWLARLEAQSVTESAAILVALSGGRIAKDYFSAVAAQAAGRPRLLEAVHFFWADERCVPPDHAESNYRVAEQCLFGPLGVATGRVHRIHGELAPARAAALAEAELRELAERAANGQPVFDLVFLGLGEDGHVASLFPGESPDTQDLPGTYRAVRAVKPPPERVTIGFATLAAAREVWVLVSGEGKTGVLREAMSGEGRTPLAKVLRERSWTRVFADLRGE